MAYQPGLSIEGLQKAQQRNLRRITVLEPQNAPGRAVQWAAGAMHRHLTAITPYDTGALKASRRIVVNLDVPRAQIFTSRNAYNPRSSTPPAEYDVTLHQRGGPGRQPGTVLDSFPETLRRHGDRILSQMNAMIAQEVRQVNGRAQ